MRTEFRVIYVTTTGSHRELLVTEDEAQARECRDDFAALGKVVILNSRLVGEWVEVAA